jgi:hypothetical protein
MRLIPVNELADIRTRVTREDKVLRLRTWVLRLLEERDELERQLRAVRPNPTIGLGVVTGPEGRKE